MKNVLVGEMKNVTDSPAVMDKNSHAEGEEQQVADEADHDYVPDVPRKRRECTEAKRC